MIIFQCPRGHTRGEADFDVPPGHEVICEGCEQRGWPRTFMYKARIKATCPNHDFDPDHPDDPSAQVVLEHL